MELSTFFNKEIPTVLTLNYFECPMLCTLVLNGLAESLKNLTLNAGDEFQVITIDINPNEKTLFANQKKKNYIKGFGLENIKDDWHFLTGKKNRIYDLARKSYFVEREIGFSKDSSDFLHTEHVILVDQNKRIRGIYNSTLQLDIEQLKNDIIVLLN